MSEDEQGPSNFWDVDLGPKTPDGGAEDAEGESEYDDEDEDDVEPRQPPSPRYDADSQGQIGDEELEDAVGDEEELKQHIGRFGRLNQLGSDDEGEQYSDERHDPQPTPSGKGQKAKVETGLSLFSPSVDKDVG